MKNLKTISLFCLLFIGFINLSHAQINKTGIITGVNRFENCLYVYYEVGNYGTWIGANIWLGARRIDFPSLSQKVVGKSYVIIPFPIQLSDPKFNYRWEVCLYLDKMMPGMKDWDPNNAWGQLMGFYYTGQLDCKSGWRD